MITIRKTMQETADRIAAQHGCDLAPDSLGRTHIDVQRVHSQGDRLDAARIARCRAALQAAGTLVPASDVVSPTWHRSDALRIDGDMTDACDLGSD